MKHGVAFRKLSRTTSHRMLMLRNLVTSLLKYEQIKTTLPKARETARVAEKIITLGKKGDLPAWSKANGFLLDPELMPRLFGPLAKRYAGRVGGYTRIHKFGNRPGDNAPNAIVELVDNPRDIKFEMTARAVGWEVLGKQVAQSGPHALIKSGVTGITELIRHERSLAPTDQGELREKTRWNLQKVLKFRGAKGVEELRKRAEDHIDTLLAQPLALKRAMELQVEKDTKKKDEISLRPNSLKPKAGQTVPGGMNNTLFIAQGALGKTLHGPKWVEQRRKLGLRKDSSYVWNTV